MSKYEPECTYAEHMDAMYGAVPCPKCQGRCPDCGKPEGSFACKVRHISINTGWAKSAND